MRSGISGDVYISSSEEIKSFTGNNLEFIGNRTLKNPLALGKERLSNQNALGVPSCIALELEIDINEYEEKKIILALGEEEKENILEIAKKYQDIEEALKELKETKEYWNNILRKIQVKTEDEEMNIMLNRMGNVPNNSM